MSHAEHLCCLATETMQTIADPETRRLRLLVDEHRPADVDHLVDSIATSLHRAWATSLGPVDEWDVEPDPAELAEIEAEWPVLAAELAVVEAHCRFLAEPDLTARRALRRAEAARDRAVAAHHLATNRTEGRTRP